LEYPRDIHVCKYASIFLFFFLTHFQGIGQSDYDNEALIESIEKIENILEQKNTEISTAVKNYSLLESKIEKRKALLGKLKKEKLHMESDIDSLTNNVKDIKNKLGNLRKEYSRILKLNYIQSLTEQRWSYILSSNTLLEGYKKWIFSKQYKDFLKTQRDDLYMSLEELETAMHALNLGITKKEELIQGENIQTKKIESDQVSKQTALLNLQKNESKVKEDLRAQKKEKKRLRQEIETAIAEQTETNVTESANAANFNPRLSKSKKGTLIWPIEDAVVTSHYGKHPHPSLKHVEILNNGVDLNGGENKTVRLVFDGEVIGRKKLADKGIMIIVKHGNYYSVYSRIVQANARAGDKLSKGSILGTVKDELHFEIWQGKEKLNPLHWLK